jgi:hypothetical protein
VDNAGTPAVVTSSFSGMTAFGADTDRQEQLAGRIRRAAAEAHAAGSDPGPLLAVAGALVQDCLVDAAGTFLRRWLHTLEEVADDAHRLADAVDLVARSYHDTESLVLRSVSDDGR